LQAFSGEWADLLASNEQKALGELFGLIGALCGSNESALRREVAEALQRDENLSGERLAERVFDFIVGSEPREANRAATTTSTSYASVYDSLPTLTTAAARRKNPFFAFVANVFEAHHDKIFGDADANNRFFARFLELLKKMLCSPDAPIRACGCLLGE
jgi:hypothetical protein